MSNAWDRQRDESGELEPALWFGRFDAYRLMGPERSLLGAYNAWSEKVRKGQAKWVPNAWRRAADKWQWKARAEAWDMAEIQKRRVVWEARAEQRREDEWRTAGRLQERAEQMLQFPVVRVISQKYEDEREKQIVEPMDWKPLDAVRFAEMASKLGRLAAGLETNRVGVSLDDVLAALPADFGEAVRRELGQIISDQGD